MNLQPLEQSWRTVLVVTPDTVHRVQQTLNDVLQKSLRPQLSVLAADDPGVRGLLSGLDLAVEYGLPAVIEPASYWATIVSAHDFTSARTLFLLAGTRLPEHWDARLVAAGQRAPDALAVSPQCARHPLLSIFATPAEDPRLSVDEIDQWLNDYAAGGEYTVPVILPACALLQGTYWRDSALHASSDQSLLETLRQAGACVLATDQLYIDDSGSAICQEFGFLPQAYLDAYLQRPPLAQLRHAMSELSQRGEKPPVLKRCLPVQLHVGHSWGGGLGRWMEDFTGADTRHNHLVLRSIGDLSAFGQTIALYRATDMDVPVQSWTLSEPILSVSPASFEYRRIIEELVDHYSVESIMISSLIGHSLDLLGTPLPTTLVLHEFFPFCPALYATFGSPCQSCTGSDLRRCFEQNPGNAYFEFESVEHWLAVRRSFVDLLSRESISVVAPTQSVVDRYRRLEPRLAQKQVRVVAHGLDERLVQSLKPVSGLPDSPSGNRLKIVMLGRLTDEKGADVLAAMLERLSGFADIFLLGTGESGARFDAMAGVRIRESYDKNELGELLGQVEPDVGLLLSTVPETFSYTLSEFWAAGIPVLATRLGAFAERIADSEDGWLVEPDADAVLARLRRLDDDRPALGYARASVRRRHVRTASEMVEDYAAVAPVPAAIPLVRYHLPRRSYRNPYARQFSRQGAGALFINHQLPYRCVLAEFLQYTSRKMEQSPRLPHGIRVILARILRRMAR